MRNVLQRIDCRLACMVAVLWSNLTLRKGDAMRSGGTNGLTPLEPRSGEWKVLKSAAGRPSYRYLERLALQRQNPIWT